MTHPVQGRCRLQRTCTTCGADPKNNKEHNKNCLFNLPVHNAETVAEWHCGQHDREQGVRVRKPDSISYVMGWDFARLTAPSEHIATSPERDIGVDLTL